MKLKILTLTMLLTLGFAATKANSTIADDLEFISARHDSGGGTHREARETDGEDNNWAVGDDYHEMRVKYIANNGERKTVYLDRIRFMDELTTKYLQGLNCPDNDVKFTPSTLVDIYEKKLFKVSASFVEVFEYRKPSYFHPNCFYPVAKIQTDEFVQALENEVEMMIERLKLYYEIRDYFWEGLIDIAQRSYWSNETYNYRRFTNAVSEDLGTSDCDTDICGKEKSYAKRTTATSTILQFVKRFDDIMSPLNKMITNALPGQYLHKFDTRVPYISEYTMAAEVLGAKFGLGEIARIRKAIFRYPVNHPRRKELYKQYEKALEDNGYENSNYFLLVLEEYEKVQNTPKKDRLLGR